MRGDLLQGCQAGTRPVARPGSITHSASTTNVHLRQPGLMIDG